MTGEKLENDWSLLENVCLNVVGSASGKEFQTHTGIHKILLQGVQHLSRVQFTDFTDKLLTNYGQIYWHTVPQNWITEAEISSFCPILREVEEARRRRKFLEIMYPNVPGEQNRYRTISLIFPDIFLTFQQKSHFNWHFPDIFPPSDHFTDFYWLLLTLLTLLTRWTPC